MTVTRSDPRSRPSTFVGYSRLMGEDGRGAAREHKRGPSQGQLIWCSRTAAIRPEATFAAIGGGDQRPARIDLQRELCVEADEDGAPVVHHLFQPRGEGSPHRSPPRQHPRAGCSMSRWLRVNCRYSDTV